MSIGEAPQRETRSAVLARLAGAQKSNRGAGGYSRWVNRPLGRQLAALAYLARLTADQVSVLSAAVTYSAIVLIATVDTRWPVAILVALLLVLGYALDSADGQVARLRGGGSTAGEWLDHVLDAIKLPALHGAIAICWFRFFDLPGPGWLLVPLGYGVVAGVLFFATILSDMLRRVDRARSGETAVTTSLASPGEPAPVLRSLIVIPGDFGLLCLVCALLSAQSVFRWTYTVLFVLNVGYLVAGSARWLREMRRLGVPSGP